MTFISNRPTPKGRNYLSNINKTKNKVTFVIYALMNAKLSNRNYS